MSNQSAPSVAGGALLVAGTCIGGGMLALPVSTALGGLVPSLSLFFLCWIFMAATGLLMLEVCLWMGKETNIVSMSGKTLGALGRYVSWCLYLFLFYSLTLAYVTECGNLVAGLIENSIPEWLGTLIFVGFFAPFVYLGARAVDRINSLFMLGLGASFVAFLVMGWNQVDFDGMAYQNWRSSLSILPLCFTAFAYQGIVPTLTHYFQNNKSQTRWAIVIGSFLPFFCYISWEVMVFGIVPVFGEGGLREALAMGQTAIPALKSALNSPFVALVAELFAFFALVTSFLGVTLGLLDFLADGLGVKKTPKGKAFLCCLIFVPPLAVSKVNPHIFLGALQYAGAFGCALLLGLLPIMMVWKIRYRLGENDYRCLGGGRPVLVLLLAFIGFELACQLGNVMGWWL